MTDIAEQEDQQQYHVVVNHEEQYSIWPVDQELPAGWRQEGTTGPRAECLSHIDEVWTDMRPREPAPIHGRARRRRAGAGDVCGRRAIAGRPAQCRRAPGGGGAAPGPDPAALDEAIARGYVFIRFTDTQGGTELGVTLDGAAGTDGADFAAGAGEVRIAGTLTLDFEPVRCVARIDLATLTGEGRLERVGDQ